MTPPDSAQAADEHAEAEADRVGQLKRELAATRERLRRLQEIDQIHTDFALAVSHELRTPATLISGYAEQLLLRWRTADEQRRYAMVEKINVSSHRLTRLINDILIITEVETSNLAMHLRDVALSEVVAQAVNEVRDRYPGGLPAITESGAVVQVHVDGFRLEQVLICLLDNAVKHSPPQAPITVTCTPQGGEVVIATSDRGGGINPADVERLFTRFGRVQRPLGQSLGGVGLGLYIARQLTEAMNGRIWVESTPGEGSTFFVAVPRR
jgi:signal transduction histidine kinase